MKCMSRNNIRKSTSVIVGLAALFGGVGILGGLFWFALPVRAADGTLPPEALVDLVKPSIVRIAEHVTGTARIPAIQVDIRRHFVAVIPDKFTDVPVDEYLTGSGFIVRSDGYVATNSHVVSQSTVKLTLASESALSALFQNALFLSDQEMQQFLQSDATNGFGKQVLNFVIDHSLFDLKNQVVVLKPDSDKKTIADLISEGYPAIVVAVNDDFNNDERDAAILKIEQTDLPALSIGSADALAVGKRTYIFGFPATAELNQNNPSEATFTQGVVSAIKQSSNKEFDIFQTDAKVSEGSSGGPLFDEDGQAVGIVTFQTGQLNQASGDNFAFALPIEIVKKTLADAHLSTSEGQYGRYFRLGYAELVKKRCNQAIEYFRQAGSSTQSVFASDKYIAPYIGQCTALRDTGQSLDTSLDRLRHTVQSLGSPFIYLLGMSLFLFGIFGAAFFWLLRQVRREEKEIAHLEQRLASDETRILSFKHKGGRLDDASDRVPTRVVPRKSVN